MEVTYKRTILGVLTIFVFYVCVSAVSNPEDDESTIEIVLIDKKPSKFQKIGTGLESAASKDGEAKDEVKGEGLRKDKSKILRNLLNALVSRLLTSSKFKNSFIEGMKEGTGPLGVSFLGPFKKSNAADPISQKSSLSQDGKDDLDSHKDLQPSNGSNLEVKSSELTDSKVTEKDGASAQKEPIEDEGTKQETSKTQKDTEANASAQKQQPEASAETERKRSILGASNLVPQSNEPKPENINLAKKEGNGSGNDLTTNAPKPDAATLSKIERVSMNYGAFCSLLQNLDLIRDKLKNRPNIGRVRNILIYESYHLTDYWGRLKFKKEGDKFVDETGYFEGIKVDKFENILSQGKMTDTGFMQKKDMGSNEINENLITIKLLLNEVAKEKNVSISNVIEEKCNMSTVEELAFYGNSPSAHNDEIVNVCICMDSFCKEPCREVIPMKKGELKFRI